MSVLLDELLANGFVTIEGAMDPDLCEDVVRSTFDREGWAPDPSTWPSGPVHLPVTATLPLGAIAPRAAAALDELVGGVGATRFCDVPDNLIVNFPVAGHTPQSPADRAQDAEGWHKDGDWFRHFLDSPEQGLLGIVLWRDVEDGQGPTCVAVDSIGPVAELLASHPEGLDPADLKEPVARILGGCTDIRSITGAQGTIVFAHPFLIHAASTNTSPTPRVISNTSVMLRHPMSFDREDGSYTAIERSILRHLGVDRLAFSPSGPRGKVASEREQRWAEGREAR